MQTLIWLLVGQALCLGVGLGLGWALGVRAERGRAARYAEILAERRKARPGLRLHRIRMSGTRIPNP